MDDFFSGFFIFLLSLLPAAVGDWWNRLAL